MRFFSPPREIYLSPLEELKKRVMQVQAYQLDKFKKVMTAMKPDAFRSKVYELTEVKKNEEQQNKIAEAVAAAECRAAAAASSATPTSPAYTPSLIARMLG